MGVFDHIVGKCPECQGELYGQTKAGDPCMNTYSLLEVMPTAEAIMIDGEDVDCSGCKKRYYIRVDAPRFVNVKLEEIKK